MQLFFIIIYLLYLYKEYKNSEKIKKQLNTELVQKLLWIILSILIGIGFINIILSNINNDINKSNAIFESIYNFTYMLAILYTILGFIYILFNFLLSFLKFKEFFKKYNREITNCLTIILILGSIFASFNINKISYFLCLVVIGNFVHKHEIKE